MTDPLKIITFGGLDIRQGETPLSSVGSLRAEGLFVYLASTRRTHSRDALVDLLWDESNPSQGLNNLRWMLALLRRQLAPYLRITRTTAAVAAESPHWLDTAAFESLLDTAEAEPVQGDLLIPAAAERMSQAVALYKGPFLSGFYLRDAANFESWMLAEQDRLHRRAVAALQKLVAGSLAGKDYSPGLAHARRLLQLEPLDEHGSRQMMRLLAATGDHQGALEQFEQLRRGLDADIGVEPEPATVQLAAQIRAAARNTVSAPIPTTPAQRRQSLPHYFTPFVGREEDRQLLAERLGDPSVRLITLHGQGGSGKTRLAVEAAKSAPGFQDGVYFVPLEGIDRGDLIAPAIAEALDFPLQSALDPFRQLTAYLGARRVLLVLDNFEQLVESADMLLQILATGEGIKLLVTSQARLDLAAEVLLSLEGLPVPPAGHDAQAGAYAAVQLFVERARRVDARFALDSASVPWVVSITRLAEGLPLALELAAARLRDESGSAIADELAGDLDRLATTRRDVPPRQRSLRAVFEHSCKQLAGGGRERLGTLAVFRGAFDLAAATAVLRLDAGHAAAILNDLVERSLLRRLPHDRFEMHGLLRTYALEALPLAEQERARRRHAAFYLARAEEAAVELPGTGQAEWLSRLAGDYDNIRAALDNALAWSATTALQLGVALLDFWITHGEWAAGREYLNRALASAADASVELRAKALLAAGRLEISGGKYPAAIPLLEDGLALAASAGDAPWTRPATAWGLRYLATVAVQTSAFRRAIDLSSRSLQLFRALDDRHGIAVALNVLGISQRESGDFPAAARSLAEGLDLARKLGDQTRIGQILRNVGVLALYAGQLDQAIAHLRETLELARQLQDLPSIADAQFYLGLAEWGRGNGEEAEAWARQSLELARRLQSRFLIAGALFVLGGAALLQGRFGEATAFAQEALARNYEINFEPYISRGLEQLAAIYARQGDPVRAARLAGAAESWRAARGDKLDPGFAAVHAATVALASSTLGETAFNLAWTAGQALSLPEAVAEALATPTRVA